jgi:hypothetical protein
MHDLLLRSSNDEMSCQKEEEDEELIRKLEHMKSVDKPEMNLYKIWKDSLTYPPYEDSFIMTDIKNNDNDSRKNYHEFLKFKH